MTWRYQLFSLLLLLEVVEAVVLNIVLFKYQEREEDLLANPAVTKVPVVVKAALKLLEVQQLMKAYQEEELLVAL